MNVASFLFTEVVTRFRDKITNMEKDILSIEHQQKEEKFLRISEIKLHKAKDMLDNPDNQQPERIWFQTKRQRMQEQGKLRGRVCVLLYQLRITPQML